MNNAEKCKRYRERNAEPAEAKKARRELAQMKRQREAAAAGVRRRLARRDAEYAASQCAAPVTVDCVRTTDGRTLVVETRGRCCIGCRSSGFVTHV